MKNSTAVVVGVAVVGVLGIAGYMTYSYIKAQQEKLDAAKRVANSASSAIDSVGSAVGAGVDFIKAGIQARSEG
jgi:type II secretory pathway pseudopilin PulG